MSVLLFGVSHRSAPVSVLEQLSTDESDQAKIVDKVLQSSLVTEAMVLSTCNRVEVYAVVEAFHGGLSVIGQVLSEHSGMGLGDLTKYAYVRYAEAAVEHLFAVASGLDSAVIGEQQVLGQVRRAYATAEANHTVGRTLHELAQRALSVGKRVHSETGIDAAGASVVSVALDMAEARLGGLAGRTRRRRRRRVDGRAGGRAPGAGGYRPRPRREPLAAARRSGSRRTCASTASRPRPSRLDDICRHAGRRRRRGELYRRRAAGGVAGRRAPRAARRAPNTAQLVICDLGMPRDVDPAVAGLPGVYVVDMDRIQREPSARAAASDAEAARAIVAAEVANYLAGQRMAEVTPTVTALRQRAADVVEAELLRLDNRLPGLEATHRDEVARTVRRVVDKLLHAPTVRVKQLASAPGGDSYAEALRELFELDPQAVDAVAGGELPLVTSDSRLDLDEDRVSACPHQSRDRASGSAPGAACWRPPRPAHQRRARGQRATPPSWSSSRPTGDRSERARSPRSASACSPPPCAKPSPTARSTWRCTPTRICRPRPTIDS